MVLSWWGRSEAPLGRASRIPPSESIQATFGALVRSWAQFFRFFSLLGASWALFGVVLRKISTFFLDFGRCLPDFWKFWSRFGIVFSLVYIFLLKIAILQK